MWCFRGARVKCYNGIMQGCYPNNKEYGITAKIMEAAIGIISRYIRIYFWDNGKEMKSTISPL